MYADIAHVKEEIVQHQEKLAGLKTEVYQVLIGQERLYSRLLIALLAGGHVLLEGVPGLAKTTVVKTLSACLQVKFRRIQFTPDLLPADVIGTQVYNPRDGAFSVKQGPVFANIVLADEINRAPAKVQSALLEAMQEQQVSIGEASFPLPQPFMVMATQNPIEQEGTYPLPEAQVDRFMLKVVVGYPTPQEERKIVDRFTESEPRAVKPVLTPSDLMAMRDTLRRIYLDDKVKDYIISLVMATRTPQDVACGSGASKRKGLLFPVADLRSPLPNAQPIPLHELIQYGASPRASIYLTLAAKAMAFLEGRGYVTPQDVKSIAKDVLRHRLILTYEAEASEISSDMAIDVILREVAVP